MQQKFLKVGSLALLQIVIVGNLQALPANASYGASLPFLYLFAVVGFFLPCIFIAPYNLGNEDVYLFHRVMIAGLIITALLPFMILFFKKKK